jgi:heat shock protein HtpX
LYERISSNVRKTWALIFVFSLFVLAIGWLVGYFLDIGLWGLGIAAIVTLFMTWGSYFKSDKIALAMSHAQPADEGEYKQLHNIVDGLCIAGGLQKPRVYVVQDEAPNAFATGRNEEHAAIAVTTGLLAKMNRDELEGVVAHELSHIKNRDILVMTLAVTLVGTVVLLADVMIRAMFWGGGRDNDNRGLGAPIAILGIVLLALSPIIAQLLQFAISRRREFLADADAVMLTRYPDGLVNALKKLGSDQTVVKTASRATAHLWIESPIARSAQEARRGSQTAKKDGAWLNRLFDTHPPLEARIEALQGTLPSLTGTWDGGTAMPPPPPL